MRNRLLIVLLVPLYFLSAHMNLILDIGNTSTKLAIYEKDHRLFLSRTEELSCEELGEKMSDYLIEKAIVSSSRELPPYISDLLSTSVHDIHFLSHESKLPIEIEYETPASLGTDRIAAAAGASFHFPGKEILIIDAGSAITFDHLSDKVYKGGSISPGLSVRFRSLYEFTDRLPLVSPAGNYSFPGKNTEASIESGVLTGIINEINGYVVSFKKAYTGAKIVLTGGDGGFLLEKIKYPVINMPDIVIDGLNYILEYNAK